MICFTWNGFPQYAARCVGAYVKAHPEQKVVVIATRPSVPIEGMERLCGCPVIWINETDNILDVVDEDLLKSITVVFENGWFTRPFNQIRDLVKGKGGKAFCMLDNNLQWYGKERVGEIVKALRFRLVTKCKYDGFMVPGKAGIKLLKFYGVGKKPVSTGFYSADASLFTCGKPMLERDKTIIYVGQLIDRKNVIPVANAFLKSKAPACGWRLCFYGSGAQRTDLDKIAQASSGRVVVNGFVQPEQLAALYQSSRAFILASKEEHWGLVVHEAALSGCYLLLSNRVGAADDFLGDRNGCAFNPENASSIVEAFNLLAGMPDSQLMDAQEESVRLASIISLDTFVKGVARLSMLGDEV